MNPELETIEPFKLISAGISQEEDELKKPTVSIETCTESGDHAHCRNSLVLLDGFPHAHVVLFRPRSVDTHHRLGIVPCSLHHVLLVLWLLSLHVEVTSGLV